MRFTGSSLAQFNYRALVSLIDEAIPVFGFISAAGAPKDGKWGIFNVRGLLIVYPFFSPSKVVLFVSVFPEHYAFLVKLLFVLSGQNQVQSGFLSGNPSRLVLLKWRTNINTYGKINLRENPTLKVILYPKEHPYFTPLSFGLLA